jgi:hypothetical protein
LYPLSILGLAIIPACNFTHVYSYEELSQKLLGQTGKFFVDIMVKNSPYT